MVQFFNQISGQYQLIQNEILLYFRKSLKSLFFLLPLLGVTNILHHLWPNPLRGPWPSFALWSFTTHFLYSFQGVFVASVYFLFDKKVIILNNYAGFVINISYVNSFLTKIFIKFQVIQVLKSFWRRDVLHRRERNETGK